MTGTTGTDTVLQPMASPEKPETRRRARIAAMSAYAVALALWTELLGLPNDTVQIFLWLWLGTIAWNVDAPWRYHLGFLRDWWLPVLGLIVYFYSRGLTDELGLPVHVTMPIHADEWLMGLFGVHDTTPTQQLQAAWCGEPCLKTSEPRWYDVFFTTVYASHFLAGLTIAAVLWVRNRTAWVQWMRRYLLINYGALVIYIVYPMAPPWMASEEGFLGPVTRISSRGWHDIGLGRFDLVLQGVGNPVAAMPSLHAGITFLIAGYAVQKMRSPWRWMLLLYPLAMCVTLVYSGEHYVVDVLAGGALAGVVLAGSSWWERRHPPRPATSTTA